MGIRETDRSHVYIGLDIGGSNTRLIALDENLHLLRCNRFPLGVATSDAEADGPLPSFERLLAQALSVTDGSLKHVVVNLGGDNVAQVAQCIERVWSPTVASVRLYRETQGDVPIFLGGLHGQSIVVMAGTGSVAIGENNEGRRAVAGGMGPMYGDDGSGYAVGRQAVRHLYALMDGMATDGPVIEVSDALRHLRPFQSAANFPDTGGDFASQLESRRILRAWAEGLSRAEVAALCAEVAANAEKGHAVAKDILAQAGQDLATLATTVAALLRLVGRVGILLIGSVIRAWDHLKPGVEAQLQSAGVSQGAVFHTVREPSWAALAVASALMAAYGDGQEAGPYTAATDIQLTGDRLSAHMRAIQRSIIP